MYRLSSPPTRSPRLYAAKDQPVYTAVESSAFFIRDHATGSEIIVFGDVEPDSISIHPRNKRVWEVAAPKIAAGALRAIFIECSYNDSVDDSSLFGHLCPRHLVTELTSLARKVVDCQNPGAAKRKRADSMPMGGISPKSHRARSQRPSRTEGMWESFQSDTPSMLSTAESRQETPDLANDARALNGVANGAPDGEDNGAEANQPENVQWANSNPPPLTGLSVYIIHVKGCLTDGPPPGEQILRELRAHGENAGLGCEFHIPAAGEGISI